MGEFEENFARKVCEAWKKANVTFGDRKDALQKKHGAEITFTGDAEEGMEFFISGEQYQSSYAGELYRGECESPVWPDEKSLSETDQKALKFIDEYVRLLNAAFNGVEAVVIEEGWFQLEQIEGTYTYGCPKSTSYVEIPFWCESPDRVEYPTIYRGGCGMKQMKLIKDCCRRERVDEYVPVLFEGRVFSTNHKCMGTYREYCPYVSVYPAGSCLDHKMREDVE